MKLKKNFLEFIYIITMSSILISCSAVKQDTYHKNNQLDSIKYNSHNKQNFDKEHTKLYMQIQKLKNNNTIYFPLDQYDVLEQFFDILDEHANFLCNYPLHQIKIEGHTDERGTPEYNIALGERRANSVKLYLQSKGVLSEQIFIVSYGKEKPITFEHNEQAYSKNRRASLIYQK